jgi:hypothetical protein
MNKLKVKKMWFEDDDLHILSEKEEYFIFTGCKLIDIKKVRKEESVLEQLGFGKSHMLLDRLNRGKGEK